MNDDRELLEAAAKAAGINGFYEPAKDGFGACILFNKGDDCLETWAPLDDDGDALRLAVKLRLDIETHELSDGCFRRVVVIWCAEGDLAFIEQDNEFGDAADDFAMVRRAIVRAAAALAG